MLEWYQGKLAVVGWMGTATLRLAFEGLSQDERGGEVLLLRESKLGAPGVPASAVSTVRGVC